jgi:ABC-type multidrug transport system permease subunit
VSDELIAFGWLVCPAVMSFAVVYLTAAVLDRVEPECAGPPLKAGWLSQLFYSNGSVLCVLLSAIALSGMTMALVSGITLLFGSSLAGVGRTAYMLSVVFAGLWSGALLRSQSFRSVRLRVAMACYSALAAFFVTLPELLVVCSAHYGCWYEPFVRAV